MLSSVLRPQRAVEVNIAIMRTFVQLRRLIDSNRDLARRIKAMKTCHLFAAKPPPAVADSGQLTCCIIGR